MKNYSFVCFSLKVFRQETGLQNILNRTTAGIPYILAVHSKTTAIISSKHNAIRRIRGTKIKRTHSSIQHCAHLHAPPYLSPESTGRGAWKKTKCTVCNTFIIASYSPRGLVPGTGRIIVCVGRWGVCESARDGELHAICRSDRMWPHEAVWSGWNLQAF